MVIVYLNWFDLRVLVVMIWFLLALLFVAFLNDVGLHFTYYLIIICTYRYC